MITTVTGSMEAEAIEGAEVGVLQGEVEEVGGTGDIRRRMMLFFWVHVWRNGRASYSTFNTLNFLCITLLLNVQSVCLEKKHSGVAGKGMVSQINVLKTPIPAMLSRIHSGSSHYVLHENGKAKELNG